ncbi:hypothetical protein [Nostoc sp. CHAB 5715]|uniref:hypothetical protein n=1 Tax=Nostoc sp. CHAB 5715 TaxID=2780400 RepID=UPI001E2ADFCA|nr:hypothetical protein [Nostoc sp. CHAB 5715]MCC5620443.1 hypothetical protein [Nostoc sp. CHAB 5715]
MAVLKLENGTLHTDLIHIAQELAPLNIQINRQTVGDNPRLQHLLAQDSLNEDEKEQVLKAIDSYFEQLQQTAVALCIDVLNTHDIKLARKLYSFLKPNDVLLGDRAFCAYADMFAIKQLDCDAVFRKHQSRATTLRKGKIIGDSDKLVTWYKPKRCPKGLNQEEFNALPPSITVLLMN